VGHERVMRLSQLTKHSDRDHNSDHQSTKSAESGRGKSCRRCCWFRKPLSPWPSVHIHENSSPKHVARTRGSAPAVVQWPEIGPESGEPEQALEFDFQAGLLAVRIQTTQITCLCCWIQQSYCVVTNKNIPDSLPLPASRPRSAKTENKK
jgi:hypothetical protein